MSRENIGAVDGFGHKRSFQVINPYMKSLHLNIKLNRIDEFSF